MTSYVYRSATAIPGTAMPPMTAYPTTSAGIVPHSLSQIPEGRYTQTIYTLIRDGKFKDVIKILETQLDVGSKNRAGWSLLGYCFYMVEDYENAARWYTSVFNLINYSYETLVSDHPEIEEYRLYLAQCLYKAGDLQNDIIGCRDIIDQAPKGKPDTTIDQGSISFKVLTIFFKIFISGRKSRRSIGKISRSSKDYRIPC
jgi:tetratricopeptide (TPR) repeat protein